eukprot:2038913-Alexandrium_andersonii.AAC.1
MLLGACLRLSLGMGGCCALALASRAEAWADSTASRRMLPALLPIASAGLRPVLLPGLLFGRWHGRKA